MNTTEEEVEFDYQGYMKDYTPDPDKIHWGPEARQKRREAAIHNNRGVAYAEKGDYDRAIEGYTEAIQLNPDYVYAYYNRGSVYREKEDYDRAIEDFTTAINLKPDLVEAYYNRGVAYYERREFAQSIEDYSKTIELKPEFAEAYYNRGEAWLHLGEWEKAKSDLTAASSMGINLITAFDYFYESVADFEESNSVKLPEDIAVMLTPQVITMRKAELQQQVVELIEQFSAEKLQAIIDYLTNLQDNEEWEATHELAGDPEIAKSLERAEADVKAGRLKRWDDVRRDV